MYLLLTSLSPNFLQEKVEDLPTQVLTCPHLSIPTGFAQLKRLSSHAWIITISSPSPTGPSVFSFAL